jgi:3' to 5' exonuclease C-terminal domain
VLADTAIIDAARAALSQEDPLQLEKISGFANRQSRRHMAAWQAAVQRARDLDDASLPEVTGGGAYSGPPPAHRWGERFPDAAARLAAAREAVTALSAEYNVPAENLISPDAVRRVSWEPPDPADARGIAAALASYGARPWQADLVAPLVAARWRDLPAVGAIPAAPQPKGWARGGKVTATARFIDGLRQLNGIIAGIIRMRWLKFLAFNMLGAALWVGCWVSAGYFGGQHITTIYHYITLYSLWALIALAIVVVAWVVLLIRKHRRTAGGN